jgi:hypothetical protein
MKARLPVLWEGCDDDADTIPDRGDSVRAFFVSLADELEERHAASDEPVTLVRARRGQG